jgi:cobalamin biosynthesis protein CbiG
MKRRAIGFGSTSRARAEDVAELVRAALVSSSPVQTLATVDRRAGLGAQVAAALGLTLRVFPASALAAVVGTHAHSERAAAAIGTPSVAEAAALAALDGEGVLIDERRVGRGCTCAVAEER